LEGYGRLRETSGATGLEFLEGPEGHARFTEVNHNQRGVTTALQCLKETDYREAHTPLRCRLQRCVDTERVVLKNINELC